MREKAMQYVQLIGLDKMPSSISSQYIDQLRATFGGDDMPPSSKDVLETLETAFRTGVPALLDSFVDAYVTTFTEEELDGLIAWNSSALGRRVSEMGPMAQQKVLEAAERWQVKTVESVGPRLSEILSAAEAQPEPQPQP